MLKSALFLSSFILFLFITGCNSNKLPDNIIVEGFVENLPDGKIYLTDAYDWKIVFDSTKTINGHFKFNLKRDTSFVSFLASVRYPDSTFKAHHQIRNLYYSNVYESKGKLTNSTSGFFLSPEGAVIRGRIGLNSFGEIRVSAGKDNELYQSLSSTGFGYMKHIDSTKRASRIQYFKRTINKHPASYFLFKEIIYDKENYTEKELEELLPLFDEEIQKSKPGRYLKKYLANRTDVNTPYPNLVLSDSKNEQHSIIDPKAKINMLVFWASWCGPCRQEIPALKKVYQAFQNKGLRMASISIDEDHNAWHKALTKENMGWQQFIIQKDQMINTKQQFNVNAIPYIILTDSLGNKIVETTGSGEDNIAILNGAIYKQL
ncbi:TlpA disulfide reductase family protein [Hymenobacter nivis]|uniref:AhpC/TSA family protein n=1 Tax=Hymenobacter nivis TaxID=1850093 RepID=A0A502H205_9BACT|nr:TlpA disulfide reductase family protein [Hymenobacter nivis]TPG67458.1 AhpC/TSA family protein [Hymenobacter nivis]